jgi:cyanate permease
MQAAAVTGSPEAPPRSRAHIARDPRFLSLSIAFAIGIFAQIGLITHLVVFLAPTLGDLGAAGALSLATVCAIVGRFGLAGLLGVDGRRKAAAINFSIQACGVTLLAFGGSPGLLLAGCVLFGLGIGNLLSLPPLILQREQAAVDVGRALALLTAVNQVFYAFAPGAFGALRDLSGSYALPFALAIAVQLLSAVVVVGGRR